MALSKEEIGIRVGIDAKSIKRDLATVTGDVKKNVGFWEKSFHELGKKTDKYFTGLLAGLAVGTVADAVQSAIQVISDGWGYVIKEMADAWVGFSQNLIDDADKISAKWKGIRAAQNASNLSKEKTAKNKRDIEFNEGDESRKLDILDSERFFAEQKYQAALKELKVQEQLGKFTEKRFKAEEDYYAAVAEMETANAALKKQLEEASQDTKQKFFDREANAIIEKIFSLRRDLKILKDEPGTGAEQEKIKGQILGLADKRKALMALTGIDGPLSAHTNLPIEDKKFGAEAISDYVSKLKESQDAWKAKTDYSNFGKAIVKAQQEADEDIIQKVAIVEIQDE